MAKKRTITIDFNKECTIKDYAKIKGISTQVISNWCKRKQIKFRDIPELNDLRLIEIGSETIEK